MLARLATKSHNGHQSRAPLGNLLVVSPAWVECSTLPTLVFRPAFALKVLAASRPPTTLVQWFPSAVPTTLAQNLRPFRQSFRLVRPCLLPAPMPATTTSGKANRRLPNTISTRLGMAL